MGELVALVVIVSGPGVQDVVCVLKQDDPHLLVGVVGVSAEDACGGLGDVLQVC